jgi:hypothetical protein
LRRQTEILTAERPAGGDAGLAGEEPCGGEVVRFLEPQTVRS